LCPAISLAISKTMSLASCTTHYSVYTIQRRYTVNRKQEYGLMLNLHVVFTLELESGNNTEHNLAQSTSNQKPTFPPDQRLWQAPFSASLPLLTPGKQRDTSLSRRTQCGADENMTTQLNPATAGTSLTAKARLRDKRGTKLVHVVVEKDRTSALARSSLSAKHAAKSTPSSRLGRSFCDCAAPG